MQNHVAGSTVPRRQLGRTLRELRESRQLTIGEVVTALEWSKPRIWRYETGQVPIQPTDVEAMCRLYGADETMTEALKALARETKAKGWWQSYEADLSEWFGLYLGLESAASHLRQYESEVIPGLLQSPQYINAVMQHGWVAPRPPEVIERRVALRMQRQKILTRREPKAPDLDIILSESALLRGFDRAVMIDQLSCLNALSELPNVSIRVLPLKAGFHRGFHGPFVILGFPVETTAREPQPTTIYQEGPTGALYLDKPQEAEVYEAIWTDLDHLALDQSESRRLISATAERWAISHGAETR